MEDVNTNFVYLIVLFCILCMFKPLKDSYASARCWSSCYKAEKFSSGEIPYPSGKGQNELPSSGSVLFRFL